MATHHHQPDASDSHTRRAHARTGISFAPDWQVALDEAIHDAMSGATTAPDLVVAFIGSAWSDAYPTMLAHIRRKTGCGTLIGSSSSGVIAGACCHESAPGITLMALWLPDATLTPLYLNQPPTVWPWGEGIAKDDVRGIILFSDPYRTDAQTTLVHLRATCPGIPMIGALASTGRTDRRSWVFLNDAVYTNGAVAITLQGPYDLLVRVSQGGTPIGEPWTITSVDHNQILTISNRPAVEVMHDTLDQISVSGYGAPDLLIGFPMDEYRDGFEREDFVARGILGTELGTGSILAGGIPRPGQSIQFLLRDADLASEDLHHRLMYFQDIDRPIVGGLLSSCKGRGTAMFGRNDHDAAAVHGALPDMPMIGLYSLGELGMVRGIPAYNAFAAALGVIVER